jgi:5-methyltetrahydrofolate--homocysteine methyltransferase
MTLENIFQNVIDGEASEVEAGVNAALAEGTSAEIILHKALVAAMDEVGRRFEDGDFFVPEMLVAARAMQSGLNLLKPHLLLSEVKAAGKVAIGTVKGDLHDIGKNLVGMMLEGAGFEVLDLGVDVSPESYLKAAQDGAEVIGMSALLTTTMGNMPKTIELLKQAGMREHVKVVIGGAPVTENFAHQIGADAFAPDASSATRTIRGLVG